MARLSKQDQERLKLFVTEMRVWRTAQTTLRTEAYRGSESLDRLKTAVDRWNQ
jgi:hypothetical protein